jgi:hypothetical protein
MSLALPNSSCESVVRRFFMWPPRLQHTKLAETRAAFAFLKFHFGVVVGLDLSILARHWA